MNVNLRACASGGTASRSSYGDIRWSLCYLHGHFILFYFSMTMKQKSPAIRSQLPGVLFGRFLWFQSRTMAVWTGFHVVSGRKRIGHLDLALFGDFCWNTFKQYIACNRNKAISIRSGSRRLTDTERTGHRNGVVYPSGHLADWDHRRKQSMQVATKHCQTYCHTR